MAASKLQLAISVLESYNGRDKIVRTLQFGSLMLSGMLHKLTPLNSTKLQTIASQLSMCRIILRLFDDLPMLAYNIYAGGLGQQEKNPVLKRLSLVKGCIDQLFYPVEHIAWAADNKIISTGSARWWVLSVAMWGLSLCIDFIRNCILLVKQKRKIQSFRKDMISEQMLSGDGHDVQPNASELKRMEGEEMMNILSLARITCDLGCAVHWSVPGFLWAGKLPNSVVGMLGTISSILGFHAMLVQRRMAEKSKDN